jgi:hypothetical protein
VLQFRFDRHLVPVSEGQQHPELGVSATDWRLTLATPVKAAATQARTCRGFRRGASGYGVGDAEQPLRLFDLGRERQVPKCWRISAPGAAAGKVCSGVGEAAGGSSLEAKSFIRKDRGVADDRIKGPASYFPAIEKKYGRQIAEWQELVRKHYPSKHMELVSMLKSEHGMGHGHANAIVAHTLSEDRV